MYHADITMNGVSTNVFARQTIATILRAQGICPEMVVVELNGRALTPSETKATPIQSGDVLEVVAVVAGG